jgi:nucleoside-diphosphate-sugar epimerase
LKVLITGAAGLVGQNLIPRIKGPGQQIVALDKHAANLRILRELHPDIDVIEADLAEPGAWTRSFHGVDAVVVAHAQIGGLEEAVFVRNNIDATRRVADAMAAAGAPYVVNISSSVVNSAVIDWYTETKKAQEELLSGTGLPQVVLRPTLMFGWFDRKHLGWLARFMKRTPVFPIPGNGRYQRQPLYAGDFSNIVSSCLKHRTVGEFNISGLERLNYIDLIRQIRAAASARTSIVNIPYPIFHLLLRIYALADRDPPFSVRQLEALVTPDIFEMVDWPKIFSVSSTPLAEALAETFRDPTFSRVVLEY